MNARQREQKNTTKYPTRLRELELDLADREFALFHLQREEHRLRKNEFFEKRLNLDSDAGKQQEDLNNIKQN